MRKFKIYDNEQKMVDEFVSTNIINEKFLKLKYANHYIYTTNCFTEEDKTLKMQFFLEIKGKTDNFFIDFLDIKEETIRVVDFIANEFKVKVEYIRIYFNGIDGFFIVVSNIALGLYDTGRNDIYLRINHVVKYIKEKTKCDYIVTDNYGLDLVHLEFETLHLNTKLYTHRISRDRLEMLDKKNFIEYFSDIQREKFRNGVREFRDEPEGKLKEVLESYIPLYSEQELSSWKKSYFNFDVNNNLSTGENLEAFKMKLANDANYNRGNNFLLYMYNTMLNEVNNYPKQESSAFKITWIRLMVTEFLVMTNEDKGLGVIEDNTNYYIFNIISGVTEYIMQLNIANYLVENDEKIIRFMYDNTKVHGIDRTSESEFEFESLIRALSNIDYMLNEKT
ncbi:hypothetical protein [Clostridium paridis]|uniref:Uncharacterized protein n=1 Tax=Clostridium paridis TaxID=2803863 RepID=A0A937K1H3_9CLOT|nr:hypothetical protein [Clostridium paridis]MBL4930431.1 hypothetical protein [Clostridium paridis]